MPAKDLVRQASVQWKGMDGASRTPFVSTYEANLAAHRQAMDECPRGAAQGAWARERVNTVCTSRLVRTCNMQLRRNVISTELIAFWLRFSVCSRSSLFASLVGPIHHGALVRVARRARPPWSAGRMARATPVAPVRHGFHGHGGTLFGALCGS